jgi:hypothetical protein
VIVTDLATTGDGTLTGMLLLDVMRRRGTAAELAAVVEPPAGTPERAGRRRGRLEDDGLPAELRRSSRSSAPMAALVRPRAPSPSSG